MASHRSRVLIVDDEDNIVLALHRVLYQDNTRYDVLLARSAEIAQDIMRDVTIDVMVTDVNLPAKSGMDLLCWASTESPNTRVIVMTAFDLTGIKDKAHAFGCLRLMRKPFDVHEMRSTILRALERRDTLAGSLADLSSIDVIQMLCISRKTTALRLSEGPKSGVILIENGELVHAVWDNLVGEDAFYEMMSVKNGLFHTGPLPPDIERTIKGDWQYLLLEGLRKLDERALENEDEARPSVRFAPFNLPENSGTRPEARTDTRTDTRADTRMDTRMDTRTDTRTSSIGSPQAEARPNNDYGINTAEVSRLIDLGFVALRQGNRDEARRHWEAALVLDPKNRRIELNLRKLETSGTR